MYVRPQARGRGFARLILAELERTAVECGRRRIVLETATEQPEAIALYTSSGYTPVPNFGRYRCSPDSRYFGKVL
jgi:ribosomal protein S18 acetylase RimI-like enzyme